MFSFTRIEILVLQFVDMVKINIIFLVDRQSKTIHLKTLTHKWRSTTLLSYVFSHLR